MQKMVYNNFCYYFLFWILFFIDGNNDLKFKGLFSNLFVSLRNANRTSLFGKETYPNATTLVESLIPDTEVFSINFTSCDTVKLILVCII